MIDFPLNLGDEKESRAWYEGSLWLSLDKFERFWPDVGPVVENGAAVKSAIREALRVQYTINAANRARWEDPNSPDNMDETVPVEETAKTCFRLLNERAGTNDAKSIAAWLTGSVLAADTDSGWHSLWNMLLYRMGEDKPSKLVSHGIPHDSARKLVAIAVRHMSEVDALEDRVDAAEQEPYSAWDILAYEDYQGNALRGITRVFEYLSFDRKWPEVMRCLEPKYIDALIKWGRANVGPKDARYEHVTIPDDIRAAWQKAWVN